MSILARTNNTYSVKVIYKPEYDTAGLFELDSLNLTFSKVKETATDEQLRNFAVALMSLTVYKDAPYKIFIVDTGELVAG